MAEPFRALQPLADAEALAAEVLLSARGVCVEAGGRALIRGVDLELHRGEVLGLIGPSGAGKTTLLKCFNRLNELDPRLRTRGEIRLGGVPIEQIHGDELRARVGMLFQQPVVFPGSIYQNVIFGIRHLGVAPRRRWPEIAERALHEAALWDEVKERLREPATRLSVGQQQRLCLARALASEPQVLLMDEPTSALDPRSTQAIEQRIGELRARHSIVLVTHNLGQARRVADRLGCLCVHDGAGELLEIADRDQLLDQPRCAAVAEYLSHS